MNESKLFIVANINQILNGQFSIINVINNKCFVTRNFPITKLHQDIVSLNKPLSVFVYELYK